MRANVQSVSSVRYRAYVQGIGWQDWAYDGAFAGTVGEGKRMEAIRIELEGTPAQYRVKYHVQSYGWMDWEYDGAIAGTVGEGKRIEAIRIRIVKRGHKFAKEVLAYFLGFKRNGVGANTLFGRRVPDLVNKYVVGEIKDQKYVYLSAQIKGEIEIAIQSGRTYVLIVSENTKKLSAPLIAAVKNAGGIIIRYNNGVSRKVNGSFFPVISKKILDEANRIIYGRETV